ncbi:MAG: 5'-methylthioadenosine/adenosylhomocysteine nucleosidase [Burkholderiales bacterium]|nr:5'-methylthioadenosine/adenosylhomocysteine nucleosidase [Burkholderiales bacterium]
MHPTGRIGIMAAMPEELQALLDVMPDETMVRRAGREFWVGHLHGRDVVAVLSRIGKVAAATTSTVLLTEFGVDQLLFTGVAGGLGDGVRVGDVVVADALMQHDMDASPLFPRFELPGLGLDALSPPGALTQQVRETVERVLSEVHLEALGLGQARVHQGLIISGDQFIHCAQACAGLRQALPQALAVEMEGAAVAQVCHDFQVPYAVVRTISDRADDDAHIDFPRFVSTVACHYSVAIIEALLRQMRP